MMKVCIQHQRRPLYFYLVIIVFASEIVALSSVTFAADLPAPPRNEADLNQTFKLYLELVINEYSTGHIIPVIVKGDDYYIEDKKMRDLNIRIPADILNNSQNRLNQNDIFMMGFASKSADWINLSSFPETAFEYLAAKQVLVLDLPPSWMPTQMLGRDTWYTPQQGQSGFGLLNNYELYSFRPNDGGVNSNLFLEQRLFSRYGVLKNSGIYTHNEKVKDAEGHSFENNNGYRRYETTFQYDHEASATSFLAGDIISASKNSWGSSVRLGGVQIKRDFGTRPDLITYPLPQFSGQAALPSTVDLLINGQKIQSDDVQSGPFLINNLPYMTGRGDAVIVTTDAVGRHVATSIPFYVSSHILKPGLVDYSVSAGQIREGFGRKDFEYGQFVSSFDTRYGLYDWLTLEGRAEFSKDVQLLGLGSVVKLFNYGVLSSSYSDSRSHQRLYQSQPFGAEGNRKGAQYSIGYSYNQNRFGVTLNHINRDKDYADLSRLGYSNLITVNSNKITTAQTFFSTAKIGALGLGYIQTQSNDFENKLLNFSWTPKLPTFMRNVTVSVSASHNFIGNEWSAAFQASIPLFTGGSSVSTGYSKDSNAGYGYLNYNRSAPSEGGFGVDLSRRFNEDRDDLNQVRINYRNQYFNTDFGGSGAKNSYDYWLGFSGSFVAMQHGFFASNRLGESFALIDTNHIPDIPVKYENTLIGKSNRNGHVFVPSVTPYYNGKFSIDPLALPSSYTVTTVEKRMSAKRGSGIMIEFPIRQTISANVYLVDEENQPIAVGSMVHRADFESSYVGMDGIAYLENLQENNEIMLQLANNQRCKAKFKVDIEQAKDQILTIGPIVCQEIINNESK